jgi:hypothetical protein
MCSLYIAVCSDLFKPIADYLRMSLQATTLSLGVIAVNSLESSEEVRTSRDWLIMCV